MDHENLIAPGQPIEKTVADLHVATMLSLIDLVLALHDAKAIDKSIVAKRWHHLASRKDLDMNEVVRRLIELGAEGLDQSAEAR